MIRQLCNNITTLVNIVTIIDTHHPHTDADYAFQFICIQKKYDQNPISDWSSIENVFIECQFSNKIICFWGEKISSLIDKAIIKCVLGK